MMKKLLIFFFTTFMYIECQTLSFELAIADVIQECTLPTHQESIADTEEATVEIKKFLEELDYQKQKRLCESARNHALHQGLLLKFFFDDMTVLSFTIRFTIGGKPQHNGSNYYLTGLKCPTSPRAVLYVTPENFNNKVQIFVQNNKFLSEEYNFTEEVAESVIYLAALNYYYNEQTGEGDYVYSDLGRRERWEICVAAQHRIGQGVTLHLVDYWTEVVGLYNFVYPWGKELKKIMAFMCNSTPKMYIRRSTLNIKITEIFVVVLEESDINLVAADEAAETSPGTIFYTAETSSSMQI